MKRCKAVRRMVCALLCVVTVLQLTMLPAQAGAPKTLLVSQAQSMAISNSRDISMKYNEILLKRMDYVEAVAGIKAKVKNKKTFRWTPLLNF